MTKDELAWKVARYMREHDKVAVSYEMEIKEVSPGRATVSMVVREDMLNAAGVTHGAVTYALADFAFALAANSHGRIALAISTSMSYPASSRAGDTLLAQAFEEALTRRTGLYRVEVRRKDGTLVGLFTGTVFRRDDDFLGLVGQEGD
ncbi:hotdog fold thioesterase [Thermosulfuriphilus sp.]